MALWLTVSIWIIFTLWSLVEVRGFYLLGKYPQLYYTKSSSIVTWLWTVFTVFWLSFQFIG
jgi:hypothetical protein